MPKVIFVEGEDLDLRENTNQVFSITLTERAAEKILKLLDEKEALALRLFVVKGGCSGYQYSMTLTQFIEDDDTVIESHGVKVLIDPESKPYLNGIEVDYEDDIMQSGFKIQNPNATSACACGTSFGADGGVPRSCN